MHVNVKLIGLFQIGRFKQEERVYAQGATVETVVADLSLPRQHFGIVLVNGVHAGSDTVLHEGDLLAIMPIVDGG
jgi:molybdopterin synthase sulfur carrier subunit